LATSAENGSWPAAKGSGKKPLDTLPPMTLVAQGWRLLVVKGGRRLETMGDVAAVVAGRISHCERREALSRREKHFIDLINCPRRGAQKRGPEEMRGGVDGTASPKKWHPKDGGGRLVLAAQKTIF